MSQPPSIAQNWQQILQIQQQNQVFRLALERGEISQAQYNAAMAVQDKRLQDLQGNYRPPSPQPTPSDTDTNLNQIMSPPSPSPQPTPTPSPSPQPTPSDTDTNLNQIMSPPSQVDQGPLVTPQQVGVVFTTGPITQAEIDAYAARGVILVPDSLKLPSGARVTGSKVEGDQILVSYMTADQVELQKQLDADASKWLELGFTDYAGKALFPDLAEYGVGSFLGKNEQGEVVVFTPVTQNQNNIVDAANGEAARLTSIRAAWQPLSDYYKAVAAKEAEFNALPAETKLAEINKAIQQGRLAPLGFPEDLIVKDVTFRSGELNFSYIVAPEAVAAKEAEFNALPIETKISELQRLAPDTLLSLTKNAIVTDVTYMGGALNVTYSPIVASNSVPADLGPVQGIKIPEGYKVKNITEEKLLPLTEAEKRETRNYQNTPNTWTKPTGQEAKVTTYQLERTGTWLGDTFIPASQADRPIPNIGGYTPRMLSAMEKSNEMQNYVIPAFEVAAVVGTAVLAPYALPVTAKAILLGAGISMGMDAAINYSVTQQAPTVRSLADSALIGSSFAVGGTIVLAGISQVPLGKMVVTSVFGRTAINAAIGGGVNYVVSGGDLTETAKGVAFGATFSLAAELVAAPAINALRARLPSNFPGAATRVQAGETTTGKAGQQVDVYTSKPVEALGNRELRIVADVTERPVGTQGVTTRSLIQEYSGNTVPTAHATLGPENFNLKVGGKTVLKGFPNEGAGYRAEQQLYHFYSAPGSQKTVNVYGGYIGIGEAYGSGTPKLSIGGRPTVLATTDTKISPQFHRLPNETEAAYLARTSKLAGQTGIAQETLLGYSAERQFVTTAQYERFGEALPGSTYTVSKKVGTFQVKQPPKGKLGKIPVVKDMLAQYSYVDVYTGKYGPAKGTLQAGKNLDVNEYAKQSTRATVNVPSESVATATAGISSPIVKSTTTQATHISQTQITSSPTVTSKVTSRPVIASSTSAVIKSLGYRLPSYSHSHMTSTSQRSQSEALEISSPVTFSKAYSVSSTTSESVTQIIKSDITKSDSVTSQVSEFSQLQKSIVSSISTKSNRSIFSSSLKKQFSPLNQVDYSRKKPAAKGKTWWGLTEYPVMTAEEIMVKKKNQEIKRKGVILF